MIFSLIQECLLQEIIKFQRLVCLIGCKYSEVLCISPSTLRQLGNMHALRPGGGSLTYFSIRGHAAGQGLISRIFTPGQGIIFLQPAP